jgi:hypothetical protein
MGAFLQEGRGRRRADAAGTACDQNSFARKTHISPLPHLTAPMLIRRYFTV